MMSHSFFHPSFMSSKSEVMSPILILDCTSSGVFHVYIQYTPFLEESKQGGLTPSSLWSTVMPQVTTSLMERPVV